MLAKQMPLGMEEEELGVEELPQVRRMTRMLGLKDVDCMEARFLGRAFWACQAAQTALHTLVLSVRKSKPEIDASLSCSKCALLQGAVQQKRVCSVCHTAVVRHTKRQGC